MQKLLNKHNWMRELNLNELMKIFFTFISVIQSIRIFFVTILIHEAYTYYGYRVYKN